MSDTLTAVRALAAFAAGRRARRLRRGGSNPLDNPPTVENPPGSGGQKLSFAYFQRCVYPIFLARAADPPGRRHSINTCAGSGCHDNASGTGGAFRVVPDAAAVDLADPANTPDVVRATDMYKNFYSAQAAVVIGAATQSRLLTKPLVQGVLHGGGVVFESADDPNAQAHRLLDQPSDAGRPGRVQHRRRQPVHAGRPDHRRVQHAMKRASRWGRGGGCAAAVPRRACIALAAPALAADAPAAGEPEGRARQVTDPYIELRTGPGRGYPVFFVAARGEWIDIELRHTDWFHVRTDGGKVGWVHRAPARDHAHRRRRAEELPRHPGRRLPEPPRPARRRLGPVQVGADAQGLGQLPPLGDAAASRARSARCRASSPAPTSGTSTCSPSRGATSACRRSSASASAASSNFPNLSLVERDTDQRQPRQRRRRRALLPDRPLRAARRLLALHRLRRRHRRPTSTAPGRAGVSFFF